MNERIQELAEQALPNIKYWNDELAKEIEAPINRAVTVDELEKFAELIVQECIDTVLDSSVEYTTRLQVAIEIKEHFGVE